MPPDSLPASLPVNRLRSVKVRSSSKTGARSAAAKPLQIGIEVEIFLYAQILIEAETLRHIADRGLDLVGVLSRVEAEHGDRRLHRAEAVRSSGG